MLRFSGAHTLDFIENRGGYEFVLCLRAHRIYSTTYSIVPFPLSRLANYSRIKPDANMANVQSQHWLQDHRSYGLNSDWLNGCYWLLVSVSCQSVFNICVFHVQCCTLHVHV